MNAPPNQIERIEATRCEANPLITAGSSPTIGGNINGPSVIRVPSWAPCPLGRYYMYFAHHSGEFIRLAYADDPAGPWRVHEPGTLRLEQAAAFRGHIASPDVHIDEQRQEIRMYFHGLAANRQGQWTGVATSPDGLAFKASEEILGKFYFRVWTWGGAWYALAKGDNSGWGELYRSDSGVAGFESRGHFLEGMRHAAVLICGHRLLVFYTRVGDAPERILASTVDMRPDWRSWQPSEPVEVLRPATAYEGIDYPVSLSRNGSAVKVCQLRDPCIFEDNGKVHLYYSVTGEMGIAMAKLSIGE